MPLVHRTDGGGCFSLDFGHPNLPIDASVEIDGRALTLAEAGLMSLQIQDRAGSSGYHIPAGTLLVHDGRRSSAARTEISTLDIAPSIIAALGLAPPAHMRRAVSL